MDYDAIFTAYYNLYRADTDTPSSTDDEYTIGLRLANEAVNHWATYDGTYWKELFANLQIADEAVSVVTGTTQYDVPDNFAEAGGNVRVLDTNGKGIQTYKIIDPSEAQFRPDDATYAYFSGSPAEGYSLNINPAPTATLNGKDIDYWYYKKPTEFVEGTDITEMSNPYFIVHRMLANRFRASRNPYYEDALRDAENALAKMKMDNDSGSWANPWKLTDHSGSAFGV